MQKPGKPAAGRRYYRRWTQVLPMLDAGISADRHQHLSRQTLVSIATDANTPRPGR